ncbi:MAG: OmpH family outer membrane protein [Phycisphaerales bacterium]|jgi:Skp family chaperone for outer membrane proteins|nr:OmpH family outer membrane protein [Phycisphaerales bacterium]MDP6312076.1 OmpH family outer membrane protein [Phycisphaerales bacterium]MDP7086639.1 OmpH family outer membrane protein [Phycisphaerales bacterium]MDP7189675.1 OmpH family outer membrane protein [Phycisphaerales bacterium]|tara:strand:- start:264 stop:995 length:732 start_codon:yes stop_codon:yes gene_type:complete
MNQLTMPRLSMLIAISVMTVLLVDRFTLQVGADDKAQAPSLGPASSLTLENEEAESVTLKVADKRLAWGDTAQTRLYSVGYVHIGKALSELLQGASYIEENQALQEELQAAQQLLMEAFQSVQERMEGLTPEDSEFEEISKEGQGLLQQRDRLIQQANAAKATLGAEQVERAYRELIDAINVVADRLEIDMVHRFIPTDDPFEVQPGPGAFQAAMLQIRLRSVLRYPEDIDITSDVLNELGLE